MELQLTEAWGPLTPALSSTPQLAVTMMACPLLLTTSSSCSSRPLWGSHLWPQPVPGAVSCEVSGTPSETPLFDPPTLLILAVFPEGPICPPSALFWYYPSFQLLPASIVSGGRLLVSCGVSSQPTPQFPLLPPSLTPLCRSPVACWWLAPVCVCLMPLASSTDCSTSSP